MKTIIIIPARMASSRFPNKPMALIDGKPMIQRDWEQAMSSKLGEVLVACCEKEVFDLIKSNGGKAIMTKPDHPSGTDRVYEAFNNYLEANYFDSIINLQGDMPIINPYDIKKVNIPLVQGFDIGTLVTNITSNEKDNINVTKAKVKWIKKNKIGEAIDFYKIKKIADDSIYHHVGIYSFRYLSLKKFVGLKPSTNELFHKLEQCRAIDFNMTIGTSFVNNVPLSVDTKDDLIKVENIIKSNKLV